MLKRISCLVVIFLSLAFSNDSNALVGSKEDVIRAAKEGREPEYIKELMEQLSPELQIFVFDNEVNTPAKQLAWFFTLRSIVTVAWNAAAAAAESGFDTPWHAAAQATTDAAYACDFEDWVAAKKAAWSHANHFGGLAAGNAAKYVLENGGTPRDRGIIDFRVAEWVVLNDVLKNIKSIFKATYQAALDELPKKIENNPFKSHDRWLKFYNKYFAELSPEAMVFLAPWLVHIVQADGVTAPHQPLFATLVLSAYQNLLQANK